MNNIYQRKMQMLNAIGAWTRGYSRNIDVVTNVAAELWTLRDELLIKLRPNCIITPCGLAQLQTDPLGF
jgi:hypothetical protein